VKLGEKRTIHVKVYRWGFKIIAQNRGKEKLPIHKQKGLNVSPDKFVLAMEVLKMWCEQLIAILHIWSKKFLCHNSTYM